MKRSPAYPAATELATKVCVELFGKYTVFSHDVEVVASVIEREIDALVQKRAREQAEGERK